MSIERYDGSAWVTCDACEGETEPVVGDRDEALEQARREGWSLMDIGRLCRECAKGQAK